MKHSRIYILIAILVLTAAGCRAAAGKNASAPGKYSVGVLTYEWRDDSRNRDVPVKIYYPEKAQGLLPVVIFSHGLGGSRDGYEYLGRGWASEGCVSVHVQHKGSDSDVLHSLRPIQAMRRAAADPQNATDRPKDISFVIDRLETIDSGAGPLKGRLDMERIGVGGHSFGAYTTLAAAGMVFSMQGRREVSFADPRVKAAIAMSTPAFGSETDYDSTSGTIELPIYDSTYGAIRIPIMHMTGTLDESPITSAPERRVPYDHIEGADQYLIVFTGGDHMIFSGRGRFSRKGDKDAMFQDLILRSSIKFWNAYLEGDAEAERWLKGGGLRELLAGKATLEEK